MTSLVANFSYTVTCSDETGVPILTVWDNHKSIPPPLKVGLTTMPTPEEMNTITEFIRKSATGGITCIDFASKRSIAALAERFFR